MRKRILIFSIILVLIAVAVTFNTVKLSIHSSREEMKIQLVVEGTSLASEILRQATEEIRRVFGKDMQVNFEFLEELERDPSGKLKKIKSRVPVRLG